MTASGSDGAQRPEIDGLRAFAILPVIFFHAGLGFPGGFMGVDVFFVISGFLIGGIILRELDSGHFSFRKFWERRFRRIAPIFLVFLVLVLAAGRLFLLPAEQETLGAQTTAALLGIANIKMLSLTGGYFAKPAGSLPLLHTWSLAVEEQFYVVAPVFLALCHRWFRKRILWLIVIAFTLSFSLSLYWSTNADAGNFYLLPSRAWELLLGCLGAWAVHNQLALRGPAATTAMALGLAAILFSSLSFHSDPAWPNLLAIIPTAGTLLVLISPPDPTGPNPVARFLSLPPLRFIGLISYSLYLWHWPLIVFAKDNAAEPWTALDGCIVIVVSILISAITWRFVEQTFRNKIPGLRFTLRPLLIGAGAVWLCAMLCAARLATHASLETPASSRLPASLIISNGSASLVAYDATDRLEQGGVIINAVNAKPRCVVVGTSHAMMLGTAIESLSSQYHIPTAFLCMPATNASALFTLDHGDAKKPKRVRIKLRNDEYVKKFIALWHPDLIIIASKWDYELQWKDNETWTWPTFQDAVSNTLAWLCANSSKVVVVGQVPEFPERIGLTLQKNIWRLYNNAGGVMPRIREASVSTQKRREALNIFNLFQNEKIVVVDPNPIFLNPDRSLRYYDANGMYYYDDHHLDAWGSMQCRPILEPFFKEIAR